MEWKENPFVIKGYRSKKLFCNRDAELSDLLQNMINGSDTTLISPRRMGKTGLIFRFFDELKRKKDVETLYLDIYSSRNLEDFLKLFAEAILVKFPEKTTMGKKFLDFLKGLRPTISFDSLSGEPQVSILYQSAQQKEYTLRSLLEFLDAQKKTIIFAIDEFQQINEYPEKNMEALLRTYIQNLKNIHFIFCGSKKSMMIDMFSNAKRPFYASTRFLSLDALDKDVYAKFIKKTFHSHGMRITDDALNLILDWSKLHTFYTQSLCNMIFSFKKAEIDIHLVKETCISLLKSNEPVFYQYRQLLTTAQWNYLIAVAKEDKVSQLTAQNFLLKYNIGTPANSKRISESLLEKELLLKISDREKSTYRIYDVFFSRWLEMEY